MSTIRVTITDKEALHALSWSAVKAYLDAADGWQRADEIPGKAIMYQHTDETGRLREISVLTRDDLADYAARMGDAIGALSRVEDRSELEIYEDLRALGAKLSRNGGSLAPESLDLIEQALQTLPAQERRIILLRVRHGLSVPEVAQVEGMTTATVVMRLHRAVEKVRSYLFTHGGASATEIIADDGEVILEDTVRRLRLS